MVLPATKNFQIAPRKPLSDKAALSRQSDRGPVSWLNIGFQAVEFQFAESMTEHELQALVHQAASGMRQETVIPKKGISEGATNQVVEIDHSNQGAAATLDTAISYHKLHHTYATS